MASGRIRRPNAGSRMTRLIEDQVEEEESDNVYETLYGGFNEEEGDGEYQEEEQEEDIVDSDFSLSEKEDEEVESDSDKKKKRVKKKIQLSKSLNPAPKPRKPVVKKAVQPFMMLEKGDRMRATTLLKSEQVAAKKKLQNSMRRHPTMPQMRRLTQEELLAEASITEEHNLASLAQFLKIEAEKKATKAIKIRYQGPVVRYQSIRIPPTNEIEECSRNFLEFTDTKNFPKDYFPTKKLKYPVNVTCVVTGQPAKYKDPLTGLPYATIEAFKYIRQHRKRLKDELAGRREGKKRKK